MADPTRRSSDDLEQRFQLLVNSVTDYAIYMLDPEGHIATWNPGARRFKGYEAEEVIGEHYSRFFTPEDREAGVPMRGLRRALEEGRFEAEGWRVRKDGTRFWAHVVVDPIRSPEGAVLGFAKITRDITEKHEAERALFESEQRFRQLVLGVRDYAIYMLDTDGRVSNWNAGAEAIKGYSRDEIVGQHFSRFYTDEDRARGEPARALETARREGKYETEAWRVRKDGTRFFANVVIDPIYDESGHFVGYAKITRDITDRRQAQQELEDARAALFQSQKLQALGELTGGIAHDFNNLITVIRGSAELLRRDELTEERRQRYLEAIIDTADRASQLTSHLLAFGRRQSLTPEVVDINLRIDAFAEVLSRTLGSKVDIRIELARDLPRIEVDLAQFETALLNAAINARDAMPDGGQLTIATSAKGDDTVCIAVSDTGTGMAKDVLERVFEPFFTTKPVGKGTGLGLSQIHGFAAQAGGRAEIDSEPGKGTTVRLLLPASERQPEPRRTRRAPSTLPRGLRVLLVEDNDQVRAFAESLLEELDCKAVSAGSAEEAIELLAGQPIDLIFSDVVMPGMSGVELAHRIRRERPDLPIVLASGYSEEVFQGAAARFEVVPKPYGAGALSESIVRALARARGTVPPTTSVSDALSGR